MKHVIENFVFIDYGDQSLRSANILLVCHKNHGITDLPKTYTKSRASDKLQITGQNLDHSSGI